MDVRDALLQATIRLVGQVGFHGATTRRIAAEAGVNEVTLFRHFRTKDALLRAALQWFAAHTPRPPLPETPVDPHAELTEWCRGRHRALYRVRDLIRTSMGEFKAHPERCVRAMKSSEWTSDQLYHYLLRLREVGLASGDWDARAATALLMGALFGDAMGRDTMPGQYPAGMRDAVDQYVSLLLAAIRATRPVRRSGRARAHRVATLAFVSLFVASGAAAQTGARPASAPTPAARPRVDPARQSQAPAQAMTLTLADALRLADEHGESVAVARAGEAHASADVKRAGSQWYPQVNFTGGYDRTLASEFSGAFESAAPSCPSLAVNPDQPLEARVAELERAASCGALGGGLNFGNLPFGQRNIYRLTFTFSQAVCVRRPDRGTARAGGLVAALGGARHGHDPRATGAGGDPGLLRRGVERPARHDRRVDLPAGLDAPTTRRARRSRPGGSRSSSCCGRRSRGTISVRRSSAGAPIATSPTCGCASCSRCPPARRWRSTCELDGETLPPPAPFADDLARIAAAPAAEPKAGEDRAPVQQAESLVHVREAAVDVARAARLPSVSVNSSYGKVGYPSDGVSRHRRLPHELVAGRAGAGAALHGRPAAGRRGGRPRRPGPGDGAAQAGARAGRPRRRHRAPGPGDRRGASGRQAPAPCSRRSAPTKSPSCAIAKGFRRSSSCRTRACRWRWRRPIARQAARDLQVARARVALLPNLPHRQSMTARHQESIMRRFGFVRVVLSAGAAALVLAVAACGQNGEPRRPPATTAVVQLAPENVATARQASYVRARPSPASSTPAREATVRAQVGGSIVSLGVDRGEAVQRGARDRADLRRAISSTALSSAQAAVASAETALADSEERAAAHGRARQGRRARGARPGTGQERRLDRRGAARPRHKRARSAVRAAARGHRQ